MKKLKKVAKKNGGGEWVGVLYGIPSVGPPVIKQKKQTEIRGAMANAKYANAILQTRKCKIQTV